MLLQMSLGLSLNALSKGRWHREFIVHTSSRTAMADAKHDGCDIPPVSGCFPGLGQLASSPSGVLSNHQNLRKHTQRSPSLGLGQVHKPLVLPCSPFYAYQAKLSKSSSGNIILWLTVRACDQAVAKTILLLLRRKILPCSSDELIHSF